jgi:myo-inositol-hexaphosphate 3-phosphohydrolase
MFEQIKNVLEETRVNSIDNTDLIAKTCFKLGAGFFERYGVYEAPDAINIIAGTLYNQAPHLDHNLEQGESADV